jgi:RNA polymerase sigma-70 factor, ECF subfamily
VTPDTAPGAGPDPVAAEVVTATFRQEWGRCLATVARMTGDLDVAEDAVQEALAAALRSWPDRGVPDRPGAWITTTARNRALDRLRREARRTDKEAAALRELERSTSATPAEIHPIDDDQLRMVFTCSHPALSTSAQVGLTLRLVCGLSVAQIARAFLEPEATTAQRLSRAKRRIRDAGIPIRVPAPDQLEERLGAALACIHLVYREGYAATANDALIRADLCEEGVRLARLLAALLPGEPEALGLAALLVLQEARRPARLTAEGELVLLADQDRARWDGDAIAEGLATLTHASAMRRPGPYQLQAAIAAEHARASTWEDTDWRAIVALYDALARRAPSPVVELNRAIAVAQVEGAAAGLQEVDRIDDAKLSRSHLLHATRGEFLRLLGRVEEARDALHRARDLAPTGTERRFLDTRLADLPPRARGAGAPTASGPTT